MPELPEVETVVRGLRRLKGSHLRELEVNDASVWFEGSLDPKQFSGAHLQKLVRRGKYIVWCFDVGFLVQHLRMTGKMLPIKSKMLSKELFDHRSKKNRQLRAFFRFDTADWVFYDTRRFGTLTAIEDLESFWAEKNIAPDPLDEPVAARRNFKKKMKATKRPVKTVLLDQSVACGVGNIYADEALFLSRIHPETPASEVSDLEVLWGNICSVIRMALSYGGSTIVNYANADGESGEFADLLGVYGRAGLPCHICQTKIESLRLGGRTTHFCSKCQEHSK